MVVIFIFHAEAADIAEFFHYIPRWRWSGRKLRYDRRTQRQNERKGKPKVDGKSSQNGLAELDERWRLL